MARVSPLVVQDLTRDQWLAESQPYRFRNVLNIAGIAATRLGANGGKLSLLIDFDEKGLRQQISLPDEKSMMELAVIMSDVLRPSSDIHFRRVLAHVTRANDSEDLQRILKGFDAAAAQIEKGPVTFKGPNGVATAAKIFSFMMDDVIEADDTAAAKVTADLRKDGILEPAWFACFNYCLDMYRALAILNRKLRDGKLYPLHAPRDHVCIYCRTTTASFSSWEHTLPESLGNVVSVLPVGYVCNRCNTLLSTVEQRALKGMPFAMTRVLRA